MGKYVVVGSLVALAAVVLWAGFRGADYRPLEVGDPAPEFLAQRMDGSEMAAAELLGRPYMLNIWATWCAPCRDEMPELKELHHLYRDRGFQVVGVSVDDRGSKATIRAFLDDLDIDFPIVHDPTWGVVDSYSLMGLPGTFLIDADGVVFRRWLGPFRPLEPDVQEDVRALLDAGVRVPGE